MNKKIKHIKKSSSQDELKEPGSTYRISPEQKDEMAITVSSYEEQEEANFRYWLQMTPAERLNLNYKMMMQLFNDKIEKNKRRKSFTIVIEKP